MNLQQLLSKPDSERNPQWEDQFLAALSEGNVKLLSPDPQEGPDGWPYLMVTTDMATPTAGESESFQKIMQWVSSRGIGLAVNPQKEYPDFVLTFGMLWSFRETGKFIHREVQSPSTPQSNKLEFTQKDLQHAGTPTEKFLPPYVRTILKSFFRDQGVFSPRILLVSLDGKNYDLAFSAESLGHPPQQEWAGIAEAIAWFLPSHYSVVITGAANLPAFIEL
jgi:hypothetical protein